MVIKIGRNDPCPCGSGKKYKQCCLKNANSINIYDKISEVISSSGYKAELAEVLNNLLHYMREESWIGACHATSATLFVALSEIGYSPELCVGEVSCRDFIFDHSWIKIDDKIIDLAVSMALQDVEVSGPIVLDKNVITMKRYDCKYGIKDGEGLDIAAERIMNMPFNNYMDAFPGGKNGLWSVVEKILPGKFYVENIKEKYIGTKWIYISSDEIGW